MTDFYKIEPKCKRCGHSESSHVVEDAGHIGVYIWCNQCKPGDSPPPAHEFVLDEKYEAVNHPDHYGGKDNPYEHIKVCEALGWGYHIGGATKYLWRMGKKPGADMIQDLDKAIWLLNRLKQKLETENEENARDSNPSPR